MTNLSEKEKIQLQYKAEQIKTSLSVNDQALYEHYVNGQGYGVLITQAIFNEITLDLLKDTEIKVQSTLQASGLKWEEIDHILLVGGSTRMPMIRQMIRLMSGLEPKFDLNPDTIVAQGASILADLIVNNEVSFSEHQDGKTTETDRVVVKDVTSQGIGLLFKKNPNKNYSFVGDYYNSVVVPRNSVLPLAVTKDLFAVCGWTEQVQASYHRRKLRESICCEDFGTSGRTSATTSSERRAFGTSHLCLRFRTNCYRDSIGSSKQYYCGTLFSQRTSQPNPRSG